MAEARRDNVEPFPPRERSIGALFSDLARDTSLLIRQEIALAKAEIAKGIGNLGSGVGMVAAGALVAFVGFIFLCLAAVYALTLVLPNWAAALIVGGVVLALGAGLALIGKGKLSTDKLVPRRTMRSLKDDAEWAKEQIQ
jgi:hypothetical protein